MNASISPAAAQVVADDIISAMRADVLDRVEHQMRTVHAGDVGRLISSGMTFAEIRDRLFTKAWAAVVADAGARR